MTYHSIFTGSKSECALYEDRARKKLTADNRITHDFYIKSLEDIEKSQQYLKALDEYAATLTDKEKTKIIDVDGKRYVKYVYDFRKMWNK